MKLAKRKFRKEALTPNMCIVLLKRLHYSLIEILSNPSSPSPCPSSPSSPSIYVSLYVSNITCSVNQAPHILGHSVAGCGLLAPPPHDFPDPPHQRAPLSPQGHPDCPPDPPHDHARTRKWCWYVFSVQNQAS